MLVSSPQARPVVPAEAEEESSLRGDLASRVLSGPGLWLDWLDRHGLIGELLAEGVIDEAVATAPHGHQLDRALNAKTTLLCVLTGCLFPGEGYDATLRIAFGLPGLGVKPGTGVPTGPALSKARVLLGEQVMRRAFELDATRTDVELGIGATWHGMETTSFDGTTAELFNNDDLAEAFGVPTGGTKPKVRIVAHVRTGSRRWIGAAVGGYHDGENALVDDLACTLRDGMLNLADRGFFSMGRWIRFSATGAHLCWRVKNGAKSVPFKTLKTLPDGSELVLLHESDGMLARRRHDAGDPAAARLPDTTARLGQFTVTTRTRSGRTKTSVLRVLTTLLDHAGRAAAGTSVEVRQPPAGDSAGLVPGPAGRDGPAGPVRGRPGDPAGDRDRARRDRQDRDGVPIAQGLGGRAHPRRGRRARQGHGGRDRVPEQQRHPPGELPHPDRRPAAPAAGGGGAAAPAAVPGPAPRAERHDAGPAGGLPGRGPGGGPAGQSRIGDGSRPGDPDRAGAA